MPSLKLSNPFRRSVERSTLRQRAADLKASLSHHVSDPQPASEPSVSPAEVNDDTELLRLGAQFEVARSREIAACEACNAAQDEADRHMPKRPACLIYHASDAALAVHSQFMMAEALEGLKVHESDIEWLRRKMPMHHEVLRPIRSGERSHRDHPGRKFDIVPHPEAQARAEEIVTAWDSWRAEKARIQDKYVTPELNAAAGEAGDAAADLAYRIAALPAQTAAGLRVKLRALAHYNASFFYLTLPELPDPDQALSHSLWRDVQAEAQPAAPPVDWHNPPAGFMAYPAIEPQGFLVVREGLRLELERLHQIASAEFCRKSEGLRERMSEDEVREREAAIRAELFMLPLTAAVDPESDGAAALRAVGRLAEPDPVLAAIAASRRAEAEMEATEAAFGGRRVTDAERAREDAAERDQKDTRAAVWATVPTTAEGRAALAGYVGFQMGLTFGPDWRAKMDQEFCGDALLALIAAIEAEGGAGVGPDGAIVELAAKFCRVYALNNEIDRAMMAGSVAEEDWKPHYEATMVLARQLAATTPTTMVGMALKCLGAIGQLAWQVANEPDPAQLDPHERIAIEFYAALRDGTLSPIFPDPSSQSRLTPDRQWAVAQASAVDVSSLSIMQLHNLFEIFVEVADQWLALAHQPWSDDAAHNEFRRPNAAGRIIDREQDRAGEIRTRIADEIRRRVPSTDNEHDWRLETLIRYEILCEGSLRHAPELRAQIAETWGG